MQQKNDIQLYKSNVTFLITNSYNIKRSVFSLGFRSWLFLFLFILLSNMRNKLPRSSAQ